MPANKPIRCTANFKSTVPTGAPRTVRLVPYACAKLRMTELPEADPVRS